ncbi:hypothetical protein CFC21_110371 [Triticum aestivum]|uniref:Uncharacterized protein n=2 Tax=Triticum aestivum TaxID=4565 RepID=A0A3B6TIF6_WHEAT|nr:late embryogenis abundant protein 2-like [Triticum aestivum]KAF7110233.1 hypothetical protein CFC21_110371 [Triticum aestivum]
MAARVFISSSRIAGQLAAANKRGVRSYAAAAAAVTRQEPSAAGAASRLAAAAEEAAPKKEFFWMRDPKTGCWMPENHVDVVDPADLRARLLFSKKDRLV